MTETFSKAIEAARKIRQRNPDILIIIGGHHISALPQKLSPEFDIGVIGEGENILLELMKTFIYKGFS